MRGWTVQVGEEVSRTGGVAEEVSRTGGETTSVELPKGGVGGGVGGGGGHTQHSPTQPSPSTTTLFRAGTLPRGLPTTEEVD